MGIVAITLIILATIAMHSASRAEVSVLFAETWVASAGADSNACTRSSPCRTLVRALDVTSSAGRIGILDSGNFGPVHITKAISITNAGGGEAILSASDVGGPVRISAGANDQIFLRGLTIDGHDGGLFGINFGSAAALHVESCIIRNFRTNAPAPFGAPPETSHGVKFAPTGASELYLHDMLIAGNGNAAGGGGILIRPAATGSAKVVVNQVRIENNLSGIEAAGSLMPRPRVSDGRASVGVRVTIRESVVSGSSASGIRAVSTGLAAGVGDLTTITLDGSSSVNNLRGIVADGARATVRIRGSAVTGNETGLLSLNSGHLDYSGNNNISGNDSNVEEPPSPL
jgi:hypothetical protein